MKLGAPGDLVPRLASASRPSLPALPLYDDGLADNAINSDRRRAAITMRLPAAAAIDRIRRTREDTAAIGAARTADGTRSSTRNRPGRRRRTYQTQVDVTALVASQLYLGNGYIYATMNGRNQVVEMHPLVPRNASPMYGRVFYRLAVDQLADIQVSKWSWRVVLHHRMLTYGSGSWHLAARRRRRVDPTGNNIQNYGASFFGNAARPSGYLTTANKLDRQKAEEIGKRWRDNYAGSANAGKTAVLEQGLEYKQVVLTAVDSQMVEQLRYTTEDVARVFQLPGLLIGDVSTLAARGAEGLMRIYYSLCLGAHFESLQARINAFFELETTKEFVELNGRAFQDRFDIRRPYGRRRSKADFGRTKGAPAAF